MITLHAEGLADRASRFLREDRSKTARFGKSLLMYSVLTPIPKTTAGAVSFGEK